MIYDVRLKISHRYENAAGNGRHIVRVVPKHIPGRQNVLASLVSTTPDPQERVDGIDFFANVTTTLSHVEPHAEMVINMAARVQLSQPLAWLDVSPAITDLQRQFANCRDIGPRSPVHFVGPSPRLIAHDQITSFANNLSDPDKSVAENVIRIGKAIYDTMTFDAKATTVDTPPYEAFANKRGVCQDFSHIMILALRALGIPAGYVSGYLRTLPPEGGVRLEGADAMHAWVCAWCGTGQGWIEYDPTNATMVGSDHIVVGYGRDYGDVSPVIGHLRSSGSQVNDQSVDVVSVG